MLTSAPTCPADGSRSSKRERRPASSFLLEDSQRHQQPDFLPSSASSNSGVLSKGTKVVIVGTGSVLQKSPHHVGRVGIIKDVPVHPTTWFKVEFDDGAVATFRPSALAPAGAARAANTSGRHSDDSDLAATGQSINKKLRSVQSASNLQQSSRLGGASSTSDDSSYQSLSTDKSHVGATLSTLDPDAWIGLKVRIRAGRFLNEVARVISSGNGWVNLNLIEKSNLELAKRANDLDVVHESATSSDILPDTSTAPGPVALSTRGERKPPLHRPPTSSRSLPTDSYREQDHSGFPALAAPTSSLTFQGIPLISQQQREKKRRIVVKYIDRQSDRLKNRPDLTYWKHQLVSSMVGEPQVELALARDIVDNICQTCNVEKWPAAKFCWNEQCVDSPIYWQLPGARGIPHTVTAAAAIATADDVPSAPSSPRSKRGRGIPTLLSAAAQDFEPPTSSCLCLHEEPTLSAVTSFLLLAPSRVVGGGGSLQGEDQLVGFHHDGAFSDSEEDANALEGTSKQSTTADLTDAEHTDSEFTHRGGGTGLRVGFAAGHTESTGSEQRKGRTYSDSASTDTSDPGCWSSSSPILEMSLSSIRNDDAVSASPPRKRGAQRRGL